MLDEFPCGILGGTISSQPGETGAVVHLFLQIKKLARGEAKSPGQNH
jgi:hypothetical protein